MSSDDADYYRNRAAEERDRAATADRPAIAEIHLELAQKYERLASEANAQPGPADGVQTAQPA